MHGIQCSFPYYMLIIRHALIGLLKMGYASISCTTLWYKVSKLDNIFNLSNKFYVKEAAIEI